MTLLLDTAMGLQISILIFQIISNTQNILALGLAQVFECSQTTIEDLMRATTHTDFAILVLTADDVTRSRGNSKPCPRDNVVFELGLFMGAIGRPRTYIVAAKGVPLKIPTDLLGVTCLLYQHRRGRTLARNLQPVTTQLRKLIDKYGPI